MKLIRLILIAMFVCLIIMQINSANPSPTISTVKQTSLESELKKLKYKFTTKVNLRSLSNDTIEINIEDPCNLKNAEQRVTCKIEEPNSCNSCPYTTCKHFDKDFKIGETIIFKNREGEGYCVAMKDMSSGCNEYHGDWVMIKASSYIKGNLNPNTYIRFCLCKKPGFIGNATLFGNCEHPFICDGDVQDINKTYDDIECKCLNEFKSKKVGDGWHRCVPPRVTERRTWSTVPKPKKFAKSFIDVSTFFNKLVQGYVGNLDELIDPCSRCPVTGKHTYARSVTIDNGPEAGHTVMCRPVDSDDMKESNYGIPLRRHFHQKGAVMSRLLKGSWGPDVMLAIKWKELWVYGSNKSDDGVARKQDCVFVFDNEDNEDFYQKLGLLSDRQYAINVGKDALLGLTVLPMSTFTPMVVPNCFRGSKDENSWSSAYTCRLMAVNLAHHVSENDIRDFLINSKENNISSTFLTRTYQERGGIGYIQSTDHWESGQKLRCAFGVALFTINKVNFQYLSFNPELATDDDLKKFFPFIAMRVRPMTKKERNLSYWLPHRESKLRHFIVDFVLSESSDVSGPFLKNNTADSNFVYK